MALQNPWVTYLYRSYKTIKASILNRMQTLVTEITDYSESNIFVIIINSFAGLVEQLNYYIDQLARESYITTARRYSSMIALTRLIDYRVRAKIGSVVDLTITAVDSSGNPVNLQNDETLDSGLIISDGNVQFITQRKVTIAALTSSVVVPAKQRVQVTGDNIGTTTSSSNQAFFINDDYQHDTLQISINAVTWELVQSFAFSGPNDTHFIVEVNEDKQAYVVFGDGVNGAIPTSGQSVLATYYTCQGESGNVESNTLTTWVTPSGGPTPPIQSPTIDSYQVTNELAAVGGLEEEDLERIRKHAPLSLRTLDRAVTLQDHKDICNLVPGVSKSTVGFNLSSKTIEFYIAPEEGGTAPSQLLTDVVNYFSDKKMISTAVSAIAAGETKLRLTITATAKFRRNIVQTATDIKSALQEEYGFNNSDVDRVIRRSDIIALIDNLDKVDYLTLETITTKPYPRITEGSHQLENNWYVEVQETTSEITSWRLAVINASVLGSDDGLARLFRTGPTGAETYEGTVTIHQADPGTVDFTSDDGTLQLGMYGTFDVGDEWIFNSYPYNEDIVFQDYTIPIYDENELDLTVNEQTV